MIRKFSDTKVKTRKTRQDQEQWAGLEVIRSLIDPSEGLPKLFFADSLLKHKKDGIIYAMENAPRVVKNGIVEDKMEKRGLDDPIDSLSYIITALYRRKGFENSQVEKPQDIYSRRMMGLNRR